jgi:import inner membrane translocase subunit TIM23
MGFFDKFRQPPPHQQAPAEQPAAAHSPELLTDAAPSTSLGGVLQGDASSQFQTEEPTRFYNPYEGLSAALDGRMRTGAAAPVYKLPEEPEFLFSEEATVHRRSWSENLQYYTGTGYLSGALLGGGQGLVAATKVKPEIGPDTARLRLNRLLNMSGTRGRTAGNALGVLGLFYAAMESGFGYMADGQVPDAATSVAAGFGTGALFRAARGPRAAAVAGTVGAVTASLLVMAREKINSNL